MAPKKKEQQKMSLGDFLTDPGTGGSWADEVEETYVMTGTQQLPPSDRPRPMGGSSSWADRGYSIRESFPTTLPDKPPYTAHLGNLSYDATVDTVTEFFEGCEIVSVRIIEDRDMQRPKGFGYVEFTNVEGLKKALTLDGESFQGRMIKIKIADPPRGGDSGRGDFIRDMGDWTRKGPLEPAPTRGPPRGGPDFGERRLPRDPNAPEPKAARDLTWERRGPLAPIPQEEGRAESREGHQQRPAPEGLGERGGSSRGRQAPAWGEGRPEGSGPPRREYSERPERPERPERAPTAAEKDMQWRDRMRPDASQTSQEGSAPGSPVAPAAAPAPAGRPRLNLQKRTVSEATDAASTAGSDSKASPFGAARPIDTAAREKEVEEKRQQALREKREADEKAKEERRLAKEAAAKAEAEGAKAEAPSETGQTKQEEVKGEAEAAAEGQENGEATSEQKIPIRTREPRDAAANPNAKPRPFDAGNWRSATGDGNRGGRGGARGGGRGGRGGGAPRHDVRSPRANGPPGQQQPESPASPAEAEPETPTQDEDGWTTVPKKGRQGRPLA